MVRSFLYYSNLVLQISIMSRNHETNTSDEVPQQAVPNLQMQALMGEMRRMMRAELEHIHERLDGVERGTPRGPPPNAPNVHRRGRLHQRAVGDVDDFEGDSGEEESDRM